MAWMGWDSTYARQEASPLDRFKNKNHILKSFGPPGVRVYEGMDGERTAREVQGSLDMDPVLFSRIMEQLIQDGALHETGQTHASPAPGAPGAPSGSVPALGAPDSASIRSHPGRTAPLSSGPSAPDEGEPSLRPRSPAEAGAQASKASIGGLPPISPPPPDSGRLSLPPADASSSGIPGPSIRPPAASAPASAPGELSPAPPNLSPLEKLIHDKYGPAGLKVYELIDGERTAEDILNETGLSESKLVEVLEFMNEQGIIKLDRPLRNPASPPPASAPRPPLMGAMGSSGTMPAGSQAARASSSSDDGVGFKPMVESSDDAAEGGMSADALPVDVPLLPPRLSLIQKAQMAAILATKHGKVGHSLLSHIDGNKDFVQLAIETSLSLRDLDIILGELGKAGLLSFKPLNRVEVRHRYGDDGMAIYRRYGRDGLLIYQMIGKAESLREIVRKSRLSPERAVDILIFVHRVLGLELPVDRDMIYRYLTKG